jgi:hypothetical protein
MRLATLPSAIIAAARATPDVSVEIGDGGLEIEEPQTN